MLTEVFRFSVKKLFKTISFCGLSVMNSFAATVFCNRAVYLDKHEMIGSWFKILMYMLEPQIFSYQ